MGGDPQAPQRVGPHGRYVVGRKLGAGGMGIVYAALDVERDAEVALKMLRRPDPDGLFRFKREFRALTDIHHDNLVSLYELVAEDERWFFTMELVEGVDFIAWVRGESRPAPQSEANTVAVSGTTAPAAIPQPAPPRDLDPPRARRLPTRPAVGPDLDRLRAALPQLVRGVMALHDGGHLHRDIKPSNVLVTEVGRVVLLDFGVVAELGARAPEHGREIVGTPVYMAPEQGIGESAGPASDWYSVGVLLYEALTGQRPFRSRRSDVLTDKLVGVAPPPSQANPATPADLDALCIDLLARAPSLRPGGAQILDRLAHRSTVSITPTPTKAADDLVLFGRRHALDQLRRAFARTRDGTAQVALVQGASGTGKSALISRFARHVEGFGALVLAGRCYERETVPFKALDPVIDELCAWMLDLEADIVDDLLGPDAVHLGSLFPVLRRLPQLDVATPARGHAEPSQLRRRAGRALRDLFARICAFRPVVVFIDDLQWSDADSAPLVDALLRAPDAPPVLWIACHRVTERPNPLDAVLAMPRDGVEATRIEVGPLDVEDAAELARLLLGERTDADRLAKTIGRESGGNPFFVRELARAAAADAAAAGAPLALAAMIRARIAALAEADRRLVRTVAISARPIAVRHALTAAGLPAVEQVGVVPRLVRLQLLRTVRSGDETELVECYHDRIRESVVEGLTPPQRRETHRRLATTLEADPAVDPTTLVDHWLGAGEASRGATLAERAADAAVDALAFERAATLYELALDNADLDRAARARLRERLGHAWAHAGRGVPAAQALLTAADLHDEPRRAHGLRREAGEQYVRAGRVAEGMTLIKEALQDHGLRVPSSAAATLATLVGQRAMVWVRGLELKPRPDQAPDPEALRYADACWAATIALVQIEPLLGSVFSTRHLRAALRIADLPRVARGVMMEALLLSSRGSRAREITTTYLEQARRLVRRADDPSLGFMLAASEGITAFELGDFADSFDRCETALALHDREVSGSFWELGQVQLFGALAGLFSGRLDRVAASAADKVAEARQRGDLYTATCLRSAITPLSALVADDPVRARTEIDDALAQWGRPDVFENQHFMAFVAGCITELYADDLDAALAKCRATDEAMRSSLLKHVQVIRCVWRFLGSLTRLHAAARRGDGDELRRVRSDARRLGREQAPWCEGASAHLRAGLALLAGRPQEAMSCLREADDKLARSGFEMFRLPVRWRLGELIGGEAGARLQADARVALEAASIRAPERWIGVFAPPRPSDGHQG